VKDYDAEEDEGPSRWAKRWDVSRWGLLVARERGARVGGAVLAFDTPALHMLRGRRDLVALWDLRVRPDERGKAIGTELWKASEAWARARGCRHLQVETQNINVTACRFYQRMGCTLGAVDRFAYWPDLPDEVQLLWVKDLSR
jgi:GNAT superfamily N-acetyltransferase